MLQPIQRLLSCCCLLLAISFTAHAQTTQPVPQNLVANPGFEDGTASWMLQANIANASAAVDDTIHHTGHNSLRITNASAFGPNVWFRASQSITPQPYTTYRISCWVKGENSGDCFIGGGPGWALRKPFPQGTFDWHQVSIEWSTGPVADDFELLLLTQSPTQKCWIDDVEFVAIRTDTAKLDAIRQKFQSNLEQQKQHLQQILTLAKAHDLANDPYILLGASIADRFINSVTTLGPTQNMSWSILQLEEVDTVLNQTHDRITSAPQKLPGTLSPTIPGPVQIHNGVFYAPTQASPQPTPIYFGGYGAFNAVINDLPNFPNYGVNLIQDGRTGPSSLNPDGSLADSARQPLTALQSAAKANVKIDFLLSPHYFPAWAFTQTPDLHNGNIGFLDYNIDHPKSREVLEHWLRAIIPTVKDQPALLSYCLSNEPAYVQSGKDPYSRPKWIKYLQNVHANINNLNSLYGTHYQTFSDVPVPTRFDQPGNLNERRAYYDWCRFNQINFANWHRWMNDIIKSIDPHTFTHIKVIAQQQLEQATTHLGNDPELYCQITDIAGCDNFVGFDNASLTSWPDVEFYYDLLNSFRDQPVFNSELHFIPDGYPAQHIPWENSRAMLWQGALHHLGAATIWVWEKPGPGGLDGSIYLRPANIYAVGRALLDANRLSSELAAINQAKPRIALLYSQPSIFWQNDYHAALLNLHTQLKFIGEKVTFVSERQLAAGHIPDVDIILSARATHVADQTILGLQSFLARGHKLILCGDDDLSFNPYHQPRPLPLQILNSPHINIAKPPSLLTSLRNAGLNFPQLIDAKTQAHASNIEYRIVDHDGKKLIPLINMTAALQTVRLPESLKSNAIDLLTGQPVNPDAIPLSPMVPMLLRVNSTSTLPLQPSNP